MSMAASRWKRISDMVHSLMPAYEFEDLKELGELNYSVRHSATFRALLKKISQRGPGHASKLLDKIGKVARFFRSTVTFTEAHSLLSREVTHFKLDFVPSRQECISVLSSRTLQHLKIRLSSSPWQLDGHEVEAKRLLRRWRKYVIHAEILLLLFYEEHPEIRLVQDYIGISKRSCYLCENFIRLHKRFVMEGEHQQLYCLWTLTQLVHLQADIQKFNFIAALTDLSSLVKKKFAAICHLSRHPLPFNAESVANFSRTSLIARRRILALPAARSRPHSEDTTGVGRLVMQDFPPEDSKATSSKADDVHDLKLSSNHGKHLSIGQQQDDAKHRRIPLKSHPRPKRRLPRKRKSHTRARHNASAHKITVKKSNVALRRSNQANMKTALHLYSSLHQSRISYCGKKRVNRC